MCRGTWSGCSTQSRKSSSPAMTTGKSSTCFSGPQVASLPLQPPAAKHSGKWKYAPLCSQNQFTCCLTCSSIVVAEILLFFFGFRWFTMTHAGAEQATGTACSGSNTWPQDAIWLQKWGRFVSHSVHCSCMLMHISSMVLFGVFTFYLGVLAFCLVCWDSFGLLY